MNLTFEEWLYKTYGLSQSVLSETDYHSYKYEWIQKSN